MPDPVTEVVLADAALESLTSPTSSDVFRAMHGHSPEVVAATAARRAMEGGEGGSLPAWWTVDSTPGSESFAAGEHRTLFGDGSEIVVSADGGAFTEYHSDENEDENTGKVFVGIDNSGPDFFGELTAWTGQQTAAERRVSVWTLPANDDQGNIFVQRPSTDTSNYLVVGDENGDLFEIGPTGAVTISPGTSETLKVDEDEIGFFGAATVPQPEIPASPNAQDIADVLVALGLCTQAA